VLIAVLPWGISEWDMKTDGKDTLYIAWSVNLGTAANVDPVNIYTWKSLCSTCS